MISEYAVRRWFRPAVYIEPGIIGDGATVELPRGAGDRCGDVVRVKILDIHELKKLLRLGGPIVAASLLHMAINVTDIVMSGQYGSSDLAGVALAVAIAGPITALLMGTISGITPLVAQKFGAGGGPSSAYLGRQGIWIGILISGIAIVLIANGHRLISIIADGNSDNAVATSIGYLESVIWGLPALSIYSVLRSTSEGMGHTKPAMIVGIIMLFLNAGLNYVFIFGHLGVPELGGVGCGVATAIVNWCAAITMIVVVQVSAFLPVDFFKRKLPVDISQIREILIVGVPIGLSIFAEWGVFSLVAICLSRFGEAVVAAHSIALNINGLTFMIPHALGMAAAIRVGHQVGGADNIGAKITGNTTVRIILVYSGVMAILLLLLNSHIAALYTNDTQVQTIAASIIIFVAVYQFIDNTQATALGTLRGYKDTRIPLVFVLVAYWTIALPIGLGLGFGWILEHPMGFSGFWIGLGAGLLFASLSLNFRRLRVANDDKRIRALSGSVLG